MAPEVIKQSTFTKASDVWRLDTLLHVRLDLLYCTVLL